MATRKTATAGLRIFIEPDEGNVRWGYYWYLVNGAGVTLHHSTTFSGGSDSQNNYQAEVDAREYCMTHAVPVLGKHLYNLWQAVA